MLPNIIYFIIVITGGEWEVGGGRWARGLDRPADTPPAQLLSPRCTPVIRPPMRQCNYVIS